MRNEEKGRGGVFPNSDGMRGGEESDEECSDGGMESSESPNLATKTRLRDYCERFGTRRSLSSHDRAASSSKKKGVITVELSSDGMDQLVDSLPPRLINGLITSLLQPRRVNIRRKVISALFNLMEEEVVALCKVWETMETCDIMEEETEEEPVEDEETFFTRVFQPTEIAQRARISESAPLLSSLFEKLITPQKKGNIGMRRSMISRKEDSLPG